VLGDTMNVITISSPNKTKVIERKGSMWESVEYITGYLSALNDNGIDTSRLNIDHKHIQRNGVVINANKHHN
tara:strand:+ start:220 stop:435 length:216 start_codon:yes stop_codon:yes gene_type:complete